MYYKLYLNIVRVGSYVNDTDHDRQSAFHNQPRSIEFHEWWLHRVVKDAVMRLSSVLLTKNNVTTVQVRPTNICLPLEMVLERLSKMLVKVVLQHLKNINLFVIVKLHASTYTYYIVYICLYIYIILSLQGGT